MDLIGRNDDLAELVDRLRNRRLVTVIGPGGIGKTALASRAATEVEPHFEDGSFVIDLTRIEQPDRVAEAVAGQLGFADFASLLGTPADRSALLIFDNCEHVLDAAADVAGQILQSSERPTILATSRSPLDIPDESVLTLGPLEVPSPEVEDVTDALRLFLERASDHGREPSGASLVGAAEVCRRLDGVPLALEIAAARLRSMSIAELLADIEARPHALARPRFRGKPTHRSVADMVGWSIDLLEERSARFFDRLSVFSGPFTASMAHAVAADTRSDDREDDAGPSDTAELLDELVASSLVAADTDERVTRYRLLHPIRAVAADRFDRSEDADHRRSLWIDHVVELAVGVVLDNSGGWSADLLRNLLGLYDNIVATLRSMLGDLDRDLDLQPDLDPDGDAERDATEDGERPLLLLAVLWGVIHQNHTAEITALGEAVLERWDNVEAAYWADAAATVATGRNLLGQSERAIELATAALPHAGGSPAAPASLLRVQAQAYRALGERDRSCGLFADAARAAEGLQSYGLAMELWVDHAVLLAEGGDHQAGLRVVDDVIRNADEREAKINRAWALIGKGLVLRAAGSEQAVAVLEQAHDESRLIGYPAGISASLRSLALVHFDRSDLDAAASAVIAVLDELADRGGLTDLRMAIEAGAQIAEAVGDPVWADLAVTAEALSVTTVATSVSSAIFDRARPLGRELTVRQAFAVCRTAMDSVRSGPESSSAPPETGSPSDPVDRPRAAASLIREGDTWRLTFAERSCVLRSSKGLADLATLLEQPGREMAAVDLADVAVVGGTRDEVLDATARGQYEDRIRELHGELEEAEANHDLGRSEKLQTELDRLVEQLTAAVGLGGRARRTSNSAERARSAVTQRLRGTVKRVAAELPELGEHLRVSISTGTYCCYRPATQTVWKVER